MERGDKVRHRASGEVGIVIAMDEESGVVEIKTGFNESRMVQPCEVEPTTDLEAFAAEAGRRGFGLLKK